MVQHHFGPNCWTLLLPREHHHECSLPGYARELYVLTIAEVDSLIFQQDGAPAPFVPLYALLWTNDFLAGGSVGQGRLIGSRGIVTLTPVNYLFWGTLRHHAQRKCAEGLQQLSQRCLWMCALGSGVKWNFVSTSVMSSVVLVWKCTKWQ
jgi:hypothetical protein